MKTFFRLLAFYFAIIGPGVIAALAGNDAGGITTYSIAGATYGYNMLWVLFFVTISLAVCQEMSARLGVVTGKGLSDLIRENFGIKWTAFAMLALLSANIAVIFSNFAGIAASLEFFSISRYISVPLVGILIWLLIVTGSYKNIERIFLAICTLFLAYIASGMLSNPDWGLAAVSLVKPNIVMDIDYVFMVIAIIGTTIAPWMQFFVQAMVVDK
ncbi:MAG: Nramp family divalent metal transporter, partial [bacterium]